MLKAICSAICTLIMCSAVEAQPVKTFIDYIQPIPVTEPLSKTIWGAGVVGARDPNNGLEDRAMKQWNYWDGQILKGRDGKYHLFASRWEQGKGHGGWWGSKAVHAVSDNLYGPYVDKGLCYPGNEEGKGHNVTALGLPDGRYALVVSETRPGDVFVANSLDGPWEHLGKIKADGLHTSNLSVMVRPDGDFMIVPREGHVWISKAADGILGPYTDMGPSYPHGIPNLEDPAVFYAGGLYHIIVNSWSTRKAYHLTSKDGKTNWVNRGLAYDPDTNCIRYGDGTVNHWHKMERPGAVVENGQLVALSLAVMDTPKEEQKGNDGHGSKIIVVPVDGAALAHDLQEADAKQKSLVKVWNKIDDVTQNPYFKKRANPPVTDADIGGPNAVVIAGLRYFDIETVTIDPTAKDKKRQGEDLWQVVEGHARLRIVNFKETLDFYTKTHDFGKGIAPRFGIFYAENYKEVIDEIARRGLWLINVWGHEVNGNPPVPKEAIAYAREKLGGRFFGLDNGEHDCRFVLGECTSVYGKANSTREGWEHFMDWEWGINNDIGRYAIALSNNTFQHYLADIPYTRMIGCQICESKPNIPMWMAILRGAAGQYGLKWWTSPAEYNLWGGVTYGGEGWGSPETGSSAALLKRAWILSYMYGASTIMAQNCGLLMPDHSLSPHGKAVMGCKAWIESHPQRGVKHTPVALIWDFYSGYVTARHAPLGDRSYMAWGNIPYTLDHYQIDAVNDAFWPGMADSGYMHNEDGFLSDTPCGDNFDVVLSNVTPYALARYSAAVVLGARIEGPLFATLRGFVDRGGSIATSVSQLTDESRAYFGIESVGVAKTGHTGSALGVRFNEIDFTYYQAKLSPKAKVVSTTYSGDPLAYEIKTETGGTLLVFLSDHMLSDKCCEVPTLAPTDAPLARPRQLLRHVQCLLYEFAESWNLVDVRANGGMQWFVNSGDRDDELLVTLVNNHPYPSKGDVRFLSAKVLEGENLMTGEKLSAANLAEFALGPNDITVIRLRADRPIMTHDFGPRPPAGDVDFMCKQLYDAFDAGTRKCVMKP